MYEDQVKLKRESEFKKNIAKEKVCDKKIEEKKDETQTKKQASFYAKAGDVKSAIRTN